MNKKNKKAQHGVTIVELLIALAIFSILMLFLAGSFANYYDSFRYLEATTSISQSTALFINAVGNSVRQASEIISSRTFSGNSYTTDDTTLILEIPSIDASANVITGTYDYMVFYLVDGHIYWITEADAASSRNSSFQQISENISNLVLTYDSQDLSTATKVNISITAEKIYKDKLFESSLNQQVYLRNN